MTLWRLKKGSERKFRFGHPWVFSSELAQSPKSVPPGGLVELQDHTGGFLALGYGHPNSQISFRTLSVWKVPAIDAGFFRDRLARASRLRKLSGVFPFSHRLCFAEGDYLPGLIIDRYRLPEASQVFVVQSSTAGMDQLLPQVFGGIEELVALERKEDPSQPDWERSAIILANDSKSRANEGIAAEPKTVKKSAPGFEPERAKLIVQPGLPELEPLVFNADLIGGQKTGFFLDQRLNISLLSRFAKPLALERKRLRVLDLCCYIGQWGSQLSHLASSLGIRAEVTNCDASAKALELAALNVEAHGGQARSEKMDVLDALSRIENQAYDVVICDPPAFIKKKRDLPTGTPAYFKLNREAIRKTAPGGLYVSCSCSGLFTEEEFRTMLSKVVAAHQGGAKTATGGEQVAWLARGGHSPDHPQRPEFPQGTYLKAWIGALG